jgi:tRNA G37 N-methylase Trm5
MLYAIDINKGRLRIVKETAKLHQVDGVITTIPSDLRTFAVSCCHTVKSCNVIKIKAFIDRFLFPFPFPFLFLNF